MPRAKFQTLTEQMFYILLCLREECCGMDILDKVPAMTQGRVSVGSGTLYNLLEQFCGEGMIRETKVEGRRRSVLDGQEHAVVDLRAQALESPHDLPVSQHKGHPGPGQVVGFGQGVELHPHLPSLPP